MKEVKAIYGRLYDETGDFYGGIDAYYILIGQDLYILACVSESEEREEELKIIERVKRELKGHLPEGYNIIFGQNLSIYNVGTLADIDEDF